VINGSAPRWAQLVAELAELAGRAKGVALRLPTRRLGGGGRGDARGETEGVSPTPLGRITFWLSR